MLSLNMQLAGVFLKTGIQFNLLLPVIVLSALEKRNYDFVFIAIVSGLFLDVFGGAPFGSFLILCLTLAWLVNWISRNFWAYEISFKVAGVFLILSHLIFEIFLRLGIRLLFFESFQGVAFEGNFFLELFYGFLGNLIIIIPIFFLWQKINWLVRRMEISAIHIN